MPAPAKSSKEADPEPDPESNPHSGQKDAWLGIPAGICDDWLAVHEPWVIFGHVNNFGVGRLNDDGVALSRHFFL
ncbi:MAG: hypothetical protein QOJ41_1480, partial [Acidobacteriaceae bacterium]|nr:hypothetical protein [Acidobacteriaceae bacterium]